MENIIDEILKGNRLVLSRVLTQVENNSDQGASILSQLFPYTGRSHLIGVTGAPGIGKSSLVNQIALILRQKNSEQRNTDDDSVNVAIIAVDPTSPFTGGAILGDRVRMRDLAGDPGVFIRSMATRGSLGGLARTTAGMVQVLDAAGYGVILIETVGAGQAEVDIARLAHTTLVIEAPGFGDDIQAIKAGILEIADILVINKADYPGVEATERALKGMLQLAHPVPHIFLHHGSKEQSQNLSNVIQPDKSWIPPIHRTIATDGEGVKELIVSIYQHRAYLNETGQWQNREQARLRAELDSVLIDSLFLKWQRSASAKRYFELLQKVYQRTISPRQAAEILLNDVEYNTYG